MAEVAEQSTPQDDVPVALFKKRNAKSKSNIRKRPATPPPASDSSSEYFSSEDEGGQRIKRRRKNGVAVTQAAQRRPDAESLEATKFAGSNAATIDVTNDATKQSNWYDENAEDAFGAKQLLGNTRPSNKDEASGSGAVDGTYKGVASYSNFIQKNPNAPSKQVGPVKAATNVRTITVTDYAPDVCKDYKQTGFCGFGDSCKFLHAREDYKQGWQLDKDWEIGSKGKRSSAGTSDKNADGEEDAEEKLLEGIPFACIICKEFYKNPIVTKCGHYFCEKCALNRYRKSPSCAACGAGTNGVFNVAKNLKKLLDKKREREKAKKEKAREAGEDVSDGDEENTTSEKSE